MPDPLVSVLIITYNHEKYIRDAIEGCLKQKTNFPIEIIIHDDASTDKTTEIVKEYAEKYPELIFPILQTENQYSKGVKITSSLIPKARGKYIAICEGDDYWCDPHKLQKQVLFLEKNQKYSGSAHQTIVVEGKNERMFKINVKSDIVLSDLLNQRLFHTASILFRKELLLKYPTPPSFIVSFDRILFILIGSNGPIKYFNEPMCIYRKHSDGISASVSYDKLKMDFLAVDYLQQNIKNFPKYRFLSFLHYTCMVYPKEKIPYVVIWKHFFFFALFSFTYFPKNLRKIASTIYRLII